MDHSIVAAIYRDTFRHGDIADDDNFFALGGDSWQAVEIAGRLGSALGIRIESIEIMRHPSIGELCRALATRTAAPIRPAVVRVAASASRRATPVQRGLFLLDQLSSPAERSTVPQLLRFERALAPELAERALRAIVERHEALRTTFRVAASGTSLEQVVHSVDELRSPFAYSDLRGRPSDAIRELYDAEVRRPFDLQSGPLLRFHLIRRSDDASDALVAVHHIVSDAETIPTIERELRQLHDGSSLAPLPFHHADYAHWLAAWVASDEGQASRAYWLRELAGARFPASPGDGGFAARRLDVRLPDATYDHLRRMSEQHEVTLHAVFHSCVKALLHAMTGVPDLVVGSAVSTRDGIGLAGQIGPFVNALPIRTRISRDAAFRDVVAAVNEAMLGGLAHKLYPIEDLADELGAPALFEVGVTMEPRATPFDEPADSATPSEAPSDPLALELLFIAYERSGGLDLRIRYRAARYTRDAAVQIYARLLAVIDAVSRAPEARLDRVLASPCQVDLDLG